LLKETGKLIQTSLNYCYFCFETSLECSLFELLWHWPSSDIIFQQLTMTADDYFSVLTSVIV